MRSHLKKNCMPLTTTKTTTTTMTTILITHTTTAATTTTLQLQIPPPLPLHLHYITMHCTTFILLHSGTLHYRERVLGLDFVFWKKRSFAVTCGRLQDTQVILSGSLNTSVRHRFSYERENVMGISINAS